MSDIGGFQPEFNPKQIEAYRREYREGANLFQKSLEASQKSSYAPQKEQFQKVMQESMEVLNQTARQLKSDRLIHQNERISKGLQDYEKNPNAKSASDLNRDLEDAKKSLYE